MSSRTILFGLTASVATPATWESASFAQAREEVTAAFARFREPVYRYVANAYRNPAEAEEITQEVFLRLYRSLCRGERIQNIQVWIFTVARNHAISVARKRRMFSLSFSQAHVNEEDATATLSDPSPT